jgi:hypothetical protein
VKCSGGTDGQAVVAGSGGTIGSGYTYLWSNATTSATLSGVSSGSYSVTVTDANGCTATTSVIITQATPLALTVSSSTIACYGGNATVTVSATGGTPAYTGTGTYTVTAGSYSYTVTDANSCNAVTSIVVTQPTSITLTMSSTNNSCVNSNDATASSTVSGGTPAYTYSWSTGATTYSISNLATGTYSLRVTDDNGCIKTGTIAIINPAALVANGSYTDVSCYNGSDGVASVSPTGGTGSYSYLWSNSTTGTTIAGLAIGSYSVTITDGNGCLTSYSTTISQPTQIILTETHIDATCATNNGSINLTVSGGTPTYNY